MKTFEQTQHPQQPKRDVVQIFVGLLAESYVATLVAANDNDASHTPKKDSRT